MPPALVIYASEAEYRNHFVTRYVKQIHRTFDGYVVRFSIRQFEHAFFESANRRLRDKSVFSRERAERIEWLAAALQEGAAEQYTGWDRDLKMYQRDRRVTLVYGDYVVVLQLQPLNKIAMFVTAYVAGANTLAKIRSSPKWSGS
jgi:hypothetical protein